MKRVSTTSIALASTDTGAVGKAWDEVSALRSVLPGRQRIKLKSLLANVESMQQVASPVYSEQTRQDDGGFAAAGTASSPIDTGQRSSHGRQLLQIPPPAPNLEVKKDYRDRYEEITGVSLKSCPQCHHGTMIVIERFECAPCRAPRMDTS